MYGSSIRRELLICKKDEGKKRKGIRGSRGEGFDPRRDDYIVVFFYTVITEKFRFF